MKNRLIILMLVMLVVVTWLVPSVSAQTGTVTPTATAAATAQNTPLPTATASPTITPAALTANGLRPEDVTFTLYELAKEIQGIVVPAAPYNNSGPPGPVGVPAHVAFQFDGTERLWVLPSQAYQAQWNAVGNNTIVQSIAQLQMLLRDKPKSPKLPLPFLPPVAATNDVAGRVRYLDFHGGSGIAYLARWSQDPDPVLASQIFYSFLGLTSDGKYIVSFQYPADTSFLPHDVSQLLPEHLAYIRANPRTYLQQTGSLLDVLPNSAFGPDLSRLDALVFSITVPSAPGILPTPGVTSPAPTLPATGDGGQPPPTPAPTQDSRSAGNLARLLAADWKWIETVTSAKTVKVPDPNSYTIRFNTANGFGITADCNIGAGNYAVSGNALTIKDLQSTLVYCGQTSLDQTFTAQLLQAASYSFVGEQLWIQLKNDGGTIKFRR